VASIDLIPDAFRVERDSSGRVVQELERGIVSRRIVEPVIKVSRFAEAVAARVTLGQLVAFQEKAGKGAPLAERILRDAPPASDLPTVPPDTWPNEVVYDMANMTRNGPRRRIAPGFEASAGQTSAAVQLREKAESLVIKLELAADVLLTELDFTLSLARMTAMGADAEAVRRLAHVANFQHPMLENTPPPNKILSTFISDLLKILPVYPSKESPSDTVLPSALRDAKMMVFEKSLWMVLYGAGLQEGPGRFDPADPTTDNRLMIGAPQKLVKYWWARFPDPQTGRPFPNQTQLFRHLKQFADGMTSASELLKEQGIRN
jgi:hypothetical protein